MILVIYLQCEIFAIFLKFNIYNCRRNLSEKKPERYCCNDAFVVITFERISHPVLVYCFGFTHALSVL